MKYIIRDWTGKEMIYFGEFKPFYDAHDELTGYIENTFPESISNENLFNRIIDEYYIDGVR